MKIGIASDHRGFKLKEFLKNNLNDYEMIDFGTNSEESTDYPDYAYKLSKAVVNKEVDYGVAICGSGIGISIACNKVRGIRCARVVDIDDVIATRNDNDANIIALSEKIDSNYAVELVKKFVETETSLEEKHVRRRNKLTEIENNER